MRAKPIIAAPFIAVVALFSASPVFADQPLTVTGPHVFEERVSYIDLDLKQSSQQRVLRTRVLRAADRVCIAAFGKESAREVVPYGHRGAGNDCADFTYASARPQIADAIRNARSGQMAALGITIKILAR